MDFIGISFGFRCCSIHFNAIDHRRLWQFAQFPIDIGYDCEIRSHSNLLYSNYKNEANNHIFASETSFNGVHIFSHQLTSTLSKWAVKYMDDFRCDQTKNERMQRCSMNCALMKTTTLKWSLLRSICHGVFDQIYEHRSNGNEKNRNKKRKQKKIMPKNRSDQWFLVLSEC